MKLHHPDKICTGCGHKNELPDTSKTKGTPIQRWFKKYKDEWLCGKCFNERTQA